ncbi:MAG: hypothetical protein QOI34_540, partial [Verrucomicrobiota bacterium]
MRSQNVKIPSLFLVLIGFNPAAIGEAAELQEVASFPNQQVTGVAVS